jgi:hypothetical protein
MALSKLTLVLLVALTVLILLPAPVSAFGAGNIASISKIEGRNWRHGDIEDMLEKILFISGKKFSSKLIKRVYFGNWLRDYSQAVDVGSLKGVQKDAIRIIVWVLGKIPARYRCDRTTGVPSNSHRVQWVEQHCPLIVYDDRDNRVCP